VNGAQAAINTTIGKKTCNKKDRKKTDKTTKAK